MSQYTRVPKLLQVLAGVAGAAWKFGEGYPMMNEPYLWRLLHFSPHDIWHQEDFSWFELWMGSSFASLKGDWPWFSLHMFLYISQLVGFILLILHHTMPHKSILFRIGTIVVLGIVSDCFGLSVAMPIISLSILHVHSTSTYRVVRSGASSRNFLAAVFWITAGAHVGAFLVAIAASRMPRQIAPFHLMNSLIDVPCCANTHCSEGLQREARLRQINEMVGTSSGFFMTVGLLSQLLGQKKLKMSRQLLGRMFLVSLVAGPAAGGADVLLIRDAMRRRESPGRLDVPGDVKRSLE
ncbi:hypothetical protein F5Y10DRAFT_288433 [Nemania abortiva]|nr:hypothetical protein F5Y10DRAFT_288433 [Nemania abortiva]